jgi:hypothetical protein
MTGGYVLQMLEDKVKDDGRLQMFKAWSDEAEAHRTTHTRHRHGKLHSRNLSGLQDAHDGAWSANRSGSPSSSADTAAGCASLKKSASTESIPVSPQRHCTLPNSQQRHCTLPNSQQRHCTLPNSQQRHCTLPNSQPTCTTLAASLMPFTSCMFVVCYVYCNIPPLHGMPCLGMSAACIPWAWCCSPNLYCMTRSHTGTSKLVRRDSKCGCSSAGGSWS